MTREEEIARQADKYTDNSSNYAEWSDDGGWSETNDIDLIEKAFKEGATWADETMIDVACEWLDKVNTDNYMDSGIFQMSELIIDFKKAMKE